MGHWSNVLLSKLADLGADFKCLRGEPEVVVDVIGIAMRDVLHVSHLFDIE